MSDAGLSAALARSANRYLSITVWELDVADTVARRGLCRANIPFGVCELRVREA
jgi:hypothetical protein